MFRYRVAATLALMPLLTMAGCISNTVATQNTAVTANGAAGTNNSAGNNNAATARAQQQMALNNLSRQVAQACMLPVDQRGAYATAVVVNRLTVQPERAKQERMDGCANAKFHLNADGTANSITVMQEYPANYGFGDALIKEIKGSTYKPPIDGNQWYVVIESHAFNKNVSAQ